MGRKRRSKKLLTSQEAAELFSHLDETGHVNNAIARKERTKRTQTGIGLEIDPLSGKDPSGSTVEVTIRRASVGFVAIILGIILVAQIATGFYRRYNAGTLSQNISVDSVANALRGGVEWGDGFTQFPTLFSVQEANEATGRIEVTVVDTTSRNELESMAASYIQATAFATNALLNNDIKTVVYRVQVHEEDNGNLKTAQFFGFLQPAGPVKNFMTFIFTKAVSEDGGFNIFCTITGLDAETTTRLKERMGGGPLISSIAPNDTHDDEDQDTSGNATSNS